MRKLLFFVFAAFLFVGCEGPAGPMGPAGEGTNWDVSEWTVNSNQWKLSGTVNGYGSYYYVDINDPSLTTPIADNGNIFVYLFTEQIASGWVQTPLPYVIHKTDGSALWTETYNFDFAPGSIRIYVTYSDFMTETVPPKSTFRIIKNW